MSIEWVTIGDCRLACADSRTIAPPPAGLILCDPPYGIGHPCDYATRKESWAGVAQRNNYPDVAGDDKPFDPSWLLDLDTPAILWGGNHYSSRLPDASGWLVWDKIRPDDLDQATCELAWSNCVKGVRRFNHLWNGCMRDSEKGENYHPTQKPVALMRWCLSLRWTRGESLVFDPYMGAGPVGVACIAHHRPYVGIELNRDYFDIAVKRIRAAYDDFALFREVSA